MSRRHWETLAALGIAGEDSLWLQKVSADLERRGLRIRRRKTSP